MLEITRIRADKDAVIEGLKTRMIDATEVVTILLLQMSRGERKNLS